MPTLLVKNAELIVTMRNNAEALIEVAEAAREYRYLCDALHAAKVNSKDEWEAHKKALEAEARLDAALAKLTEEV